MKSLKINALLNIIQNICKVLFPLVTVPYASRVLGVENYGKVSFGNSIIRYFILFAGLGISSYAQREAPALRDDKKKISMFANQVFTINVVATIISYVSLIIVLFLSDKLKGYSLLILLQSSAIILNTIGIEWINVVYEDYFYITIKYILIQLISVVLMFLFVNTSSDYYMFALIMVFATAGGSIFNIFHIRKYIQIRLSNPKECVKHLKTILLLFSVSITSIIYISSDITIIGLLTTDKDVGIYTMVSNIYSVVKQVISAVITVSIPRMAYYLGKKHINQYKNLAQKVLNTLIAMLFPSITGLAFLGPHILMIMGGKEYVMGEKSLIVLSFSLLFAILAGFYANGCLLLAKKDKLYLFATSLSAFINVGFNFFIIPSVGIMGAAITTLLAEFVMATITGYFAFKEYHIFVETNVLVSTLIGTLFVSLACYCIRLIELNSIYTIVYSFFSGVLLFYIVAKVMKNPFAEIVDSTFNKIIEYFKKKQRQ